MKNKGQALVEFIIILPILLLLLLGTIDIGSLLYKKYTLENDLDYVTELVKQNKQVEMNYYLNQHQLTSNIENKERTTTITLTKKVTLITPGLSKVLNIHSIEAKRVISSEP